MKNKKSSAGKGDSPRNCESKDFKKNFNKRILDTKKNFTNGRKDLSGNIINFQELPQDQLNWGWKIYYKWRKFLHKLRNW